VAACCVIGGGRRGQRPGAALWQPGPAPDGAPWSRGARLGAASRRAERPACSRGVPALPAVPSLRCWVQGRRRRRWAPKRPAHKQPARSGGRARRRSGPCKRCSAAHADSAAAGGAARRRGAGRQRPAERERRSGGRSRARGRPHRARRRRRRVSSSGGCGCRCWSSRAAGSQGAQRGGCGCSPGWERWRPRGRRPCGRARRRGRGGAVRPCLAVHGVRRAAAGRALGGALRAQRLPRVLAAAPGGRAGLPRVRPRDAPAAPCTELLCGDVSREWLWLRAPSCLKAFFVLVEEVLLSWLLMLMLPCT